MPIIKIQPDSVRQQGSRLSQAASDLTALHWEINRLANQLDWEVRGKGHVEAKIGEAATLGKKLYEEAQRLSEYLKTCATALEDADSQGQQGISTTMSTASLSTGLLMGSSAVGAGVLAGLIVGGRSYVSTKLEWHKERIASSEISRESIQSNEGQTFNESVTRVSDYLKGTFNQNSASWKEMSLSDKEKLLQDIENNLADIQGRRRRTIELVLPDGSGEAGDIPQDNPDTAGYDESLVIHLNQKEIGKQDISLSLYTLLHEGRHAYQMDCVKGITTTGDLIEVATWRNNLAQGHYISHEKNLIGYLLQPVERDARKFAKAVLATVNPDFATWYRP